MEQQSFLNDQANPQPPAFIGLYMELDKVRAAIPPMIASLRRANEYAANLDDDDLAYNIEELTRSAKLFYYSIEYAQRVATDG